MQLSEYRNKRSMVLGAAGFIGRWVARYLFRQGSRLFLVDRNQDSFSRIMQSYGFTGEIIECDLAREENVRQLIRDVQPQVVFNLAGYGVNPKERDEKTAYQLNANLLHILCQVLGEIKETEWKGLHLIHVGSALEYGTISGDLAEDSRPNPTTLYGQSKLKGTQILLKEGSRATVARLFTVYGPGELPGRLLPSLIEAAGKGADLPLTAGQQKRDFTYVEDVAEGLLRIGLLNLKKPEVVNLATGKLVTVRSFVEKAAEILGIGSEKLLFGKLPTRHEEMNHLPVSNSKLKKLIDWLPPTGIENGISNTFQFLSHHPVIELNDGGKVGKTKQS